MPSAMTEIPRPSGERIVVTGGAGFIGSRVVGRLLDQNEVVVYDDFSRDALTKTAYLDHPNLRVVRGDILDPGGLREAMEGADSVVHCAGVAGIDTVTRSPVRTMRVNMIGSANVLEASAAVVGLRRIVCFSTSEVFGQQAFMSGEGDRTVIGAVGEARWTYAVSKLAEEHLAIAYHQEIGLPATVLRPFNIYGPGQVGEGALSIFIQRALRGDPLEIYGSGTQIRAWCYVDDMVDAVMLSLVRPAAVGETFNIGNRRSVETIHRLAMTVLRVTESDSPIIFAARDDPDVELRIPSVDKARDLLGFEAEVDLEEGIARTAEHYGRAAAAAGA